MRNQCAMILGVLLLVGCASHRKAANCSEIRYRLDHMEYNEDQREWIEEEWRQCKVEYDSLARIDSVKYKGIYGQFADSTGRLLILPPDSTPAPANSGAER
jgi:hypothetical protein